MEGFDLLDSHYILEYVTAALAEDMVGLFSFLSLLPPRPPLARHAYFRNPAPCCPNLSTLVLARCSASLNLWPFSLWHDRPMIISRLWWCIPSTAQYLSCVLMMMPLSALLVSCR